MIFREATISDFKQIHEVRMAVRENILPRADLITEKDYDEYLNERGKGWVCEIDNSVVGFSIVDLKEKNVWALFVDPNYEGKGIGKKLQELMLDYYFSKTEEKIWLGTSPNTRAEIFYRKNGWTEMGKRPNGEIHFEMEFESWNVLKLKY